MNRIHGDTNHTSTPRSRTKPAAVTCSNGANRTIKPGKLADQIALNSIKIESTEMYEELMRRVTKPIQVTVDAFTWGLLHEAALCLGTTTPEKALELYLADTDALCEWSGSRFYIPGLLDSIPAVNEPNPNSKPAGLTVLLHFFTSEYNALLSDRGGRFYLATYVENDKGKILKTARGAVRVCDATFKDLEPVTAKAACTWYARYSGDSDSVGTVAPLMRRVADLLPESV